MTFFVPSARTALTPLRLLAVNVALNASDASALPRPSMAEDTPSSMSVRLRKSPFWSLTLTDVFPIWMAPSFILFDMSRMTAARAVPASLPCRLLLDMAISRAVTVSILWPWVCRTVAEFL